MIARLTKANTKLQNEDPEKVGPSETQDLVPSMVQEMVLLESAMTEARKQLLRLEEFIKSEVLSNERTKQISNLIATLSSDFLGKNTVIEDFLEKLESERAENPPE